jgi:ribosomal protein S18 acetylase RimI-like enzyme
VRRCTQGDLLPLEWDGMFTPHREILCETYQRQLKGEVEMLVGELEQRPIAQAWVDLTKRRDERVGVIWALRVHPRWQGQGFGAQVLAQAESLLRARGFAQSELGVERNNPRARKLYERLGYRYDRELREHYSYAQADGQRVHAVADQWMLRKLL